MFRFTAAKRSISCLPKLSAYVISEVKRHDHGAEEGGRQALEVVGPLEDDYVATEQPFTDAPEGAQEAA